MAGGSRAEFVRVRPAACAAGKARTDESGNGQVNAPPAATQYIGRHSFMLYNTRKFYIFTANNTT